ncbi:hypothetical protein RSAG8_09659, partial [Rhizoctonia solani AG-8 WAC10335]
MIPWLLDHFVHHQWTRLVAFLFYQVWRYLFLRQFGQPEAGDTGGHVTYLCRLYIGQICLYALFFLSRDEQSRAPAVPPGAPEQDFSCQSSSDSAARPLTKVGQPLTAEHQAKLDKLERERTEHEMHASTAPPKTEMYGKNVVAEGKHNAGPDDFTHPDAIKPQRVVWLLKGTLGVAEAGEKELKQQGIEASTEQAVIDEKGHVQLTGPPPGGDDDALFG